MWFLRLKIGHYLHTVDTEELSAAYLKITCFECHFAAESSLSFESSELRHLSTQSYFTLTCRAVLTTMSWKLLVGSSAV